MTSSRRARRGFVLQHFLFIGLCVGFLITLTAQTVRAQQPPLVTLTPLSETQSGDITIEYLIEDADSDSVGLLVEYSTDSGTTWLPATVTGDTADIKPAGYDSSLVWNSKSDLDGQAFEVIWVRITPHDDSGWGTAGQITFPLDNKPPESINAWAASGDKTLFYVFDEQADSTALDPSNIGLSGGLTIDTIVERDHWVQGPSMPTAREYAAAAVLDGRLYVIGGNGGQNTLEVYDPDTGAWTARASLNHARNGAVAVVLKGLLYVVGGGAGFEVYDPRTDIWTDLNFGSSFHYGAGGVIGDKIYFAEDYHTYEYDPVSKTTVTRTAMSTPRWYTAYGVADGKLYVAGGENEGSWDKSNTLEIYDPVTDSWSTGSVMPAAISHAAGVMRGMVFDVMGGDTGAGLSNLSYTYDIGTDTWIIFGQDLLMARYAATAGLIRGQVYLVGGNNGGYLDRLDLHSIGCSQGYELTLSGGQSFVADTDITVTATGISDRHGNINSSSLQAIVEPEPGTPPRVFLTPLTGTRTGDIPIAVRVTDHDGNPVTLVCEYSADAGGSWFTASILEGVNNLFKESYPDTLTWQSQSDLPGQHVNEVLFRVTPYDGPTHHGSSATIIFGLDNSPPASITATGLSGYDTVTFHFDEPVEDATATNTGNISLSGLTVSDISVRNWSSGQPLPDPGRSGSASAVLNDTLYVIGGNQAGHEVRIYDPATDTWAQGEDSNQWRDGARATVLNDDIYVCSSAFERYDPATDSWSYPSGDGLADQSWATIEAIGDHIYIAGGSDQSHAVHRYNPDTDTWTNVSGMPTARRGAVSGVIDGRMYVAGGEIDGTTYYANLEVYDPVTDTWTTKAPLPKAIAYAAAGVAWGRLIVVGGFDGTDFNSDVYVYDPASDSWSTAGTIPNQRWKTTAGVIGNQLYIASGYCGGYITALDIYDWRGEYDITLGSGEVLPPAETAVTITASNITDRQGNTLSSPLSNDFYPETGQPPAIDVTWPVTVQRADVTLAYEITDAEGNPVSLTTEYSTDHGSNWQPATVTGTTEGIYPAAYSGSLVWNSATDLSDEDVDLLRFRITPSDNATTPGSPNVVIFELDNRAPVWMGAEGASGDSTFPFWFNEPVTEASATSTGNFSLSSPYSIASIDVNDLWERSATFDTVPAGDAAVVGMGGRLYVLGGWDGSNHLDRLEVYDPVGDSWSSLAPLLSPRSSAVAAAVAGKIYLLSGENAGGRVNAFEVYDSVTDTWTALGSPPCNPAAWDAQARGIGDRLYVCERGSDPATMFIYDPETDSWTSKSGGLGTGNPATAVIDGQFYFAGGWDDSANNYSSALRAYDPSTGVTTTLASMPTPRDCAVGGAIDGKFYVVGGGNTSGALATVEIYDPDSGSWSTGPDMPLQRTDYMGDAVGSQFYHGRFINYQGTDYLVFDRLDRGKYDLTLASGQVLPPPPNTLTLTASNITDWAGNTLAGSLDSTFTPSSGQAPSIRLDGPAGPRSGDLTIHRTIFDAEGNPVWLTAEYQLTGEGTWNPATVQGDTAAITSDSYRGTLIWQSDTDLPGQEAKRVRLRVTPRDNETTSGTADTAVVWVDNRAPTAATATGVSGGSSLTITFNEPVHEPTATNTSNYTLSGSLTVSSVDTLARWQYVVISALTTRDEPGIGVMDGKLYVVGGWDGSSNYTTAEVYDPATDSWSSLPDMPTPRGAPHVYAINGKLYVISGHDPSGWINSMDIYDPDTGLWSTRPTEGQGSWWNRNGGVINGKLYVNTGDEGNPQIAIYDPQTDVWSYLDNRGLPYGSVAAGVIDDKLYLAGGWHNSGQYHSGDLMVFDPADSTRTWLAGMPTSRSNATGAVVDGLFYVIDGCDDSGDRQIIEVYDPSTNQWSTGLSGTTHGNWGVGAVLDGRVYKPSGSSSQFDVFDRNSYRLNLGAGQTLPSPPDSVTVTVTGLTDWPGNTLTGTIEITFTPSTGDPPSVALFPPAGVHGGSVSLSYRIADAENNPVSLRGEYQLPEESTWQTATLSGTTIDIPATQYEGSVVWEAGSDLPGQVIRRVRFRLTPSDCDTEDGTPNVGLLDVDTRSPQSLSAEGASGDSIITFWFDEPVSETSAAGSGNITLSGGLTVASVAVRENWSMGQFDLPDNRHSIGLGALNGKLYAVGGLLEADHYNRVDVYDPVAGAWSQIPDMPTPRREMVVIGLGGLLYVMGGLNNDQWFEIVEVYDPESDSWSSRTSAPTQFGNWKAQAAVIDGRIYVHCDGSIFIYDPDLDSWEDFEAGISWPNDGSAIGVIDGKLYIAGGYNYNENWHRTELVVFDPETRTTSSLTGMNRARRSAVGAVIDGRFYVMAGWDDSGAVTVVEAYDPATDQWTESPLVPNCLNIVGAVIEGRLYTPWWDGDHLTFDVYDRDAFTLELGEGETLPSPPETVTVTASNISDRVGNTTTSDLTYDLTASTGQAPEVDVYQPSGICSGDITVPYRISDAENNPVWLLAEYRLPGDALWLPASVTGDTTMIAATDYEGTLVWNSALDLPNRRTPQAQFRLTPRDNPTDSGTAGVTLVDLDNRAPIWVSVRADQNATSLLVRFNEPVSEATATDPANYTLSSGLTVASASVVETWTTRAVTLPGHRREPGIGVLNGKLYVIGGTDQYDDFHEAVMVYDPTTDTWDSAANIPGGRSQPVVTTINGRLYVFEGYDWSGQRSDWRVYDPGTDSWTLHDEGSFQFYNSNDTRGGMINGRLYVNHVYGPEIRCFDPFSESVTVVGTGLNNYTPATGIIGDRLYIAGGENEPTGGYSSDLVVFDPATGVETSLTPMPTARFHLFGAVLDGRFYVIGGYNDGGQQSVVEIYDPASDTWSTGQSAPMALETIISSAVIDGVVYLFRWYDDGQGNYTSVFDTYERNSFRLTLDAGHTLPFEPLTLQVSGIEDWWGNAAGTLTTDFVPDDGNDNPTISITPLEGEHGGDVTLTAALADNELDALTLSPRWSADDGATWHVTTTPTDTTIAAPVDAWTFLWQSAADLPGADIADLRLRIRVTDNEVELGNWDEIGFHLDNNAVPVADIENAIYSPVDTTWVYSWILSDDETDTLSIRGEYSTDDGVTWLRATTSSDTTGIVAGPFGPAAVSDSLRWYVQQDLPDAVQEVLFRIVPRDNDEGIPGEWATRLNLIGVPEITVTDDLSGEWSGDLTFHYEATDPDSDPIDLTFEYEYPAGTWNEASVSGDTTLTDPGMYSNSVTWHSASDLDGHDEAALTFRITPRDGSNDGYAGLAVIHLDNNAVPQVSTAAAPAGVSSRDVPITLTVSDAEGDDLCLGAAYSTDRGSTWQSLSMVEDYSSVSSAAGYPSDLTWRTLADLGYTRPDSVLVRVWAADNDTCTAAVTDWFGVTNYVGDYSGDLSVDFSDFATLVKAWNEQDTYHDIGPATGTVPDLVPDYDGQINYEDLAVYAQMWTWSDAQGSTSAAVQALARVPRPASDDEAAAAGRHDQHPVMLRQPEIDDPWAADTGRLELILDVRHIPALAAAGFALSYDPEHLRLLEISPGTFLGREGTAGNNLITLKRVEEEAGTIELMLGRIAPERPEVAGSGRLATLRFEKLSEENSDLALHYDLRDRRADAVVTGAYATTVEALRLPDSFALLPNYPNPFNAETVIRFQLPTAQKVRFYVFNVRGQRVATLADEEYEPGYHTIRWDGRSDDGRRVASGIYIYLIQAGPHRASKKMTIIK